jgi:hypothetical protein
MKIINAVLLCLLLLAVKTPYIFSQDSAWDVPEPRTFGKAVVPALIGGGEILLQNSLFMIANHLYGFPWALPNAKSVRRNLTEAWIWEDTDGFIVNQLGHPFQGSLYFTAARVNGFGFYQNIFFSAFGSATWESLFESNDASINDFITTVSGSLATGEMLYRLYVEACAAGIPPILAFVVNPMAGLHRVWTGWTPPPAERNLYEFQIYLGGGLAQTHSSITEDEEGFFSFRGPFAEAGFSVVYGNPFEQDTLVPYRHFELAMSYGMNFGKYHDIRVISDGYLFSFSPVYTSRNRMSTGLTLHMDFISQGRFHMHDSIIDQYSSALNWTVKHQHLFSENTSMQIKAHAGFTFMGVSQYFSPIADAGTYKHELKNYGGGLNSKLILILENSKFGRIDANLFLYGLWTYPGTTAFSKGSVYWLFTDITYSRHITQHFSLGVTGSLARERGSFSDFPDTNKKNDKVKLFAAWNL